MDHRQLTCSKSQALHDAGEPVRRGVVRALILALALGSLSQAVIVHAEPPLEAPPRVDGPVQYVGPDTYILLDADGHPQPMLGMKYEDFVAAWKESQHVQSTTTAPRFVIESVDFTGQVRSDHAELTGKIVVRQMIEAPAAVPLGMAAAILREPAHCELVAGNVTSTPAAKDDSGGPSFVDYDRQQGGFVARLYGRKGERFEILLPMLVPLVRDGSETSLRLNIPQTTVGKLSLEMDTPVGTTTVSNGSILTTEPASHGATRFAVAGLASDFQLAWSPADRQQAELATVLSAVGNQLVSIDGHSIRTDVHLTVRSFGRSFDRCQIRLPPDAQLIQNHASHTAEASQKYSITVSDAVAAADATGPQTAGKEQIAIVEFAEKQSGPVDVELSIEQPLGDSGTERAMNLTGFEVLGAVRQYGDVAVRVADDWELHWESSPLVRQIERTELPANLQQQQPIVAFQYDRLPWSLPARLERRPLRIHVTPEYRLDISPDEAQLHVHLSYQLPGARAFEFRVQLNGWELTADPIESGGLVDGDRVIVNRDGFLVLPLGQASSRRADISFTLRRSVPVAQTSIELPLPAPEVDSIGVGDLIVTSAPEIDLQPAVSRSKSLSPIPLTAATSETNDSTGRQEYRFRFSPPDATFAADRSARQRELTWKASTHLDVDRRELRATQTLEGLIRNQPLTQLTLDVPNDWSIVDDQIEIDPSDADTQAAGGEVEQISDEGNVVHSRALAAVSADVAAEDGSRKVTVSLPRPRLGPIKLRAQYRSRWPVEAVGPSRLSLSLPQPGEGAMTANNLSIASSPDLSVQLDQAAPEAAWQTVVSSPSERDTAALELSTTEPQASVPLIIRSVAHGGPQRPAVERIWLETWMAGNTVQDRAAYRFASAGSTVTVELPPQTSAEEIEAVMDGQAAEVFSRLEGRLVLAVPAAASDNGTQSQLHTLELRYRHPRDTGLFVRQQLTPPQLVGASPLTPTYWQLILPADEQLVQSPPQLVSLDEWQWLGTFWGRRPTKTQADLESWVSATTQPAPSRRQNEYLFSGFVPAATIEVLIVPRWLIVLIVSASVLAVTIAWTFVPPARRAWIGVAFALLVATLAAAFPTTAVLLGQASLLGLAASLATMILRRRWPDRTRQMPLGVGSTQLRIRAASNRDSAATPPLSPTTAAIPGVPMHASEERE